MLKKIYIVLILSSVLVISNKAYGQVEIVVPDSNDVIETEEEDEEDEEAIEFDSIIVETNGPYWDFLRPREFSN